MSRGHWGESEHVISILEAAEEEEKVVGIQEETQVHVTVVTRE